MSYQHPIEYIENDVLIVALVNTNGEYCLWQKGLLKDTGSDDGVYFEYCDQIDGSFNSVVSGTVTKKKIDISVISGKIHNLKIPEGFDKFLELESGLNNIYGKADNPIVFAI
jgi:hypothetical protein